jgi:hypothetical protein
LHAIRANNVAVRWSSPSDLFSRKYRRNEAQEAQTAHWSVCAFCASCG